MYSRLPKHIGIIPDGNRRWASSAGLDKEKGYKEGVAPSKQLYEEGLKLGIDEVTAYCFTQENMKRPSEQIVEVKEALVEFVDWVDKTIVSILVVGDYESRVFPEELRKYVIPADDRQYKKKLNLLVNYSWKWDIRQIEKNFFQTDNIVNSIGSREISRVDLVLRWGNRSRLSGFVPLQSAYADIYIFEELYPDFKVEHLHEALKWYETQDITMGG